MNVQSVLEKAAQRARRHAELDAATRTVQKELMLELDPESLPWGAAMP